MANVVLWHPIDRFLGAIFIFLVIYCGILFLKKVRDAENRSERILLLGYCSMILGLGIMEIILYFFNFYSSGYYENHAFYQTTNLEIVALEQRIFHISFIVCYIGAVIYLICVEYTIKGTKYIFSIFNGCLALLFCIAIFLLPFDIAILIYVISWISFFLSFGIINVLFMRKSDTHYRVIGVLLFISIMIMGYGNIINGYNFGELAVLMLILGQVFRILGISLMIGILVVEEDAFNKIANNLKYIITAFLCVVFGITFMFVMLNAPDDIFYTTIILAMFVPINSFVMYKSFKSEPNLRDSRISREKRQKELNILRTFTKPAKITIEEVNFHKRKKICLVCKSEIGRFNVFLCPNCDVLYCQKCAETLVNLENVCWACENPIDESKPINKISTEKLLALSYPKKPSKKKKSGKSSITIFSEDFLNTIQGIEWDPKDKSDFLNDMINFPEEDRIRILNKIIKESGAINEKLKRNKMGV